MITNNRVGYPGGPPRLRLGGLLNAAPSLKWDTNVTEANWEGKNSPKGSGEPWLRRREAASDLGLRNLPLAARQEMEWREGKWRWQRGDSVDNRTERRDIRRPDGHDGQL
jgi:hypothetical protein